MKNLHSKILPYKVEYTENNNLQMWPLRIWSDNEWLNSHTLYFRGLLMHDGQGKLWEAILNEYLEEYGGKIIKIQYANWENEKFEKR